MLGVQQNGVNAAPPPQVQWAYIVGGTPDANRRIQMNLQKEGINVAGIAEDENKMTTLPKAATVVIVLSDMVSHPARNKAVEWAKAARLPFIQASAFSWAETRKKLAERGLLGPVPASTPAVLAPTTTIADRLSPEKREEIAQKVYEEKKPEPKPEPKPEEEKKLSPEELRKMDKSKRAKYVRQVALKVFDRHRHELKTFCNWEAADEVAKELGFPVSDSLIHTIRKEANIEKPPHGFKKAPRGSAKPRAMHKRGLTSMIANGDLAKPRSVPARAPGPPILPPITKPQLTADNAEADFDVIQQLMDEWVEKHHVAKVYCAFDNGEWSMNFEQVAIVTREKKYQRNGAKK